ncbi:sulfurtransferase complex subunit TusC [Enterobacteriaceae endosymbiont of Donacia clavipes]|uniref:sulfurtransferase complex subunit TusC n=1 Tax=Enterobacteriaceae endosymbiont of Donacia clavipes TaxID=2675775 RepID=UPI001449B70C|nr:sulfurtransferase complex subunit TusC [Enterobacteriaceae endosymbiont of Donacia clavipes]QJC33393.1 sulfurtransferase complex subunit TusC [Enterobacteriaceae endosymbiont of Donacia clavipes]
MNNKIAFIFKTSPYGNNIGKEGLDTVISISSFTEDIALFFIGDGILQIKNYQQTKNILLKKYNISFSILNLCNINNFFVCLQSLKELGIKNYKKNNWIVPIKIIDLILWKKNIADYNIIMNF